MHRKKISLDKSRQNKIPGKYRTLSDTKIRLGYLHYEYYFPYLVSTETLKRNSYTGKSFSQLEQNI